MWKRQAVILVVQVKPLTALAIGLALRIPPNCLGRTVNGLKHALIHLPPVAVWAQLMPAPDTLPVRKVGGRLAGDWDTPINLPDLASRALRVYALRLLARVFEIVLTGAFFVEGVVVLAWLADWHSQAGVAHKVEPFGASAGVDGWIPYLTITA